MFIVNTFFKIFVDNENINDIIRSGGENVNERIKLLRETLGISQEEFGRRIGSPRNTIATYELGRRTPSNTTLTAICKEFHVNPLWLEGKNVDMFTHTPESVIDEIAEDFKLDDIDKKIIEKYLELNDEQRSVIKEYIKSIFS